MEVMIMRRLQLYDNTEKTLEMFHFSTFYTFCSSYHFETENCISILINLTNTLGVKYVFVFGSFRTTCLNYITISGYFYSIENGVFVFVCWGKVYLIPALVTDSSKCMQILKRVFISFYHTFYHKGVSWDAEPRNTAMVAWSFHKICGLRSNVWANCAILCKPTHSLICGTHSKIQCFSQKTISQVTPRVHIQ